MSRQRALHLVAAATIVAALSSSRGSVFLAGSEPIQYRFTFPEPEHHWMQVEATLTSLGPGPLELRMSRASPGRYSLHDFAKNVYDVHVEGANGQELAVTRPDPYGWTVAQPGASVTLRYKVFGDRVDGTYLAVDTSHAHINMPAAVMWARGLDDRPSTLTFVPPRNSGWQVATQLHPGTTPLQFTAPNLQYLMDSPVEFGPLSIQEFDLDGRRFRFSAHHTGTAAELDAFVRDVEKIVRQEGAIFGEYPAYEPGSYTFLADYLPYASGDGMEHRNSTVMTSSGSIRADRNNLLDTVAHEFFHGWNVERIRPRSLEPFDFERANMSGELWLAEGFTQYYGPIALSRAGLENLQSTVGTMAGLINAVAARPGRSVRSAEEMSQMASFADGGRTVDRTNWSNTYISYYSFGGAIALALDLSLRSRTDGRTTLDDFMRAMWRVHGKPGGAPQGYVGHPYTIDDAQQRLAEVSGDATFAREFFARYVQGRELPDFALLLQPAGFIARQSNAGRAWWGDVHLTHSNGLRVADVPASNSPAYKAGLDVGAEIRQLDGVRVTTADDVAAVLRRHTPGVTVSIDFVDRSGALIAGKVTLAEDPRLDVVPVESTGGTLTSAQRAFRRSWLGR